MKSLTEILIKCSGANEEILAQCPTEKTKFIGIGSTIILTAILASFSGGYALYFTFQSVPISIALGFFWGIVIFSLDRYIVSSIKKTGNIKDEILTALPRIFMALVLAITISKPLELRLFQDAVNKAMGEIANTSISKCEQDWNMTRDKLIKSKSDLESKRKAKSEEIYNKDAIYNSLSLDYQNNDSKIKVIKNNIELNNKIIASGTSYKKIFDSDGNYLRTIVKRTQAAQNAIGNNTSLRNDLVALNSKISQIEAQKTQRKATLKEQVDTTETQYSRQIAGVQAQIDDHNSKRAEYISDCSSKAKNAQDIPARLEALSKITSDNASINIASWLITLLFIILETAPVVVKLLSARGPYDEILERIEYEKVMEQKIIISNLNDEVNTIIKISTEKNKNKLDAELKANEELLKSIALAQADLAKLAVEKWKQQETEKINNNTSYINQTDNNTNA